MRYNLVTRAAQPEPDGASGFLHNLALCRKASVAPLTAIMLLPIAGSIAFAVELGSWNYMQRSLQNAADSAAIAAASVNSGAATTGSTSRSMPRWSPARQAFRSARSAIRRP
jgi:Flp pilus assembly protein TadG